MAQQLTFDLPVIEARGRENFFISSANATAAEMVESEWPQGRMVLAGPRASGKSHLAGIWSAESEATVLNADDLPQHIENFTNTWPGAILVEDIDRISSDASAGEALFHLLNAQTIECTPLLLTMTGMPAQISWPTKDLASRLEAVPVAQLQPPDDALLSAIMVKLMADRQIEVAPGVIEYLFQRVERSFEALRHLVDTLDRYALAERRAITRPLAARVLDILADADDN